MRPGVRPDKLIIKHVMLGRSLFFGQEGLPKSPSQIERRLKQDALSTTDLIRVEKSDPLAVLRTSHGGGSLMDGVRDGVSLWLAALYAKSLSTGCGLRPLYSLSGESPSISLLIYFEKEIMLTSFNNDNSGRI